MVKNGISFFYYLTAMQTSHLTRTQLRFTVILFHSDSLIQMLFLRTLPIFIITYPKKKVQEYLLVFYNKYWKKI